MSCEVHIRGSKTCKECRNNLLKISGLVKDQLEDMEHTLGLNYSKTPTRNYFYTDTDDVLWNDLVNKEFATKHKGWESDSAYFMLTISGVKAVYRRKLTDELLEKLKLLKK
jgi:hypothetical protein